MGIGEHKEPGSKMNDGGAGAHLGTSTSLIVLAVGAAGSLALLINAGRTTPKPLLLMMGLWVLSPFVALFAGNAMSKRWSPSVRAALRKTMIVVALGSVVFYALDTVRHIAGKPAAMYVLIPPVSWVLIAVVAWSAFGSDKRSRRSVEV
jgi:hypothetical protein